MRISDWSSDVCSSDLWFDLHLYLTNWGTRRLMMRLPERLVSRADIGCFLREVDWVEIWTSGDNTLVDIYRDEVEPDDDWDDGSGWLAALAPLRADVAEIGRAHV